MTDSTLHLKSEKTANKNNLHLKDQERDQGGKFYMQLYFMPPTMPSVSRPAGSLALTISCVSHISL